MRQLVRLLEGHQTLGRGLLFWLVAAGAFVGALGFGALADGFAIENSSYFLVWIFMALGLALTWGLTGTMSFGQTAFFGIGGYAYALFSLNWGTNQGMTLLAAVLALLIVALAAGIVGYLIFYGGVKGVLVSIITLALTLGLETFLSQTAGSKWAVGAAELGGFNGINNVPPLSIPWNGADVVICGQSFYFVLLSTILVVYLSLRILANSKHGNAMVAVRENPLRAEALGYNVKAILCGSFVLGSILAGISGIAYSTWGQYISPDTMGLSSAALPVIWVAVSGRDLTATLLGTLLLLALSQGLAVYGNQYALAALGVVLILSVLRCPIGLVETPLRWVERSGKAKLRGAGAGLFSASQVHGDEVVR